jgi:hypothetical protein
LIGKIPSVGRHLVSTQGTVMPEDKKESNRRFLCEALEEFKSDVLSTLDAQPGVFFNGTLELTVQDGMIRTAKPGIQKCRHATLGKS